MLKFIRKMAYKLKVHIDIHKKSIYKIIFLDVHILFSFNFTLNNKFTSK